MNTDTLPNSTAEAPQPIETAPQPIEADEDGMLPEYDFDYSKAIRNPYAGKITSRSKSVTLAPDVAAVFVDSDAVNTALRSLIAVAQAAMTPNPPAVSPNAADASILPPEGTPTA